MLIYHPAYDAYHCVFRMLVLIKAIPNMELEKARILDFYLLFPSAIESIRLPHSLSHGRKIGSNLANKYRDPINVAATFRELRHIQEAALKCIAASGIISVSCYEKGVVARESFIVPDTLSRHLDGFVAKEQSANFILQELSAVPLKGADGLKHRTGLLEHRYDFT